MIGRRGAFDVSPDITLIDPAQNSAVDCEIPPPVEVDIQSLAYIIYTSGSTGLPKGVMLSHRAVANTIADINRRFDIGVDDRVLSVSNLSFDLSVYDIFGVLAAGGTLVLPEEGKKLEPEHWLELMRAHQITLWNSVPALFTMLLDSIETNDVTSPLPLRRVLLSGDWIPISLPDRLTSAFRNAKLAALGGATEAAIWSNHFEVDRVDASWISIPYGTPLANQRYHILDSRLEDRPDWVAGDLYIAGDGLAEGYWGDPRRTNAQFIRHPRTGERLYRSGDQARYWADGTIEFLGRQDGQVKIGGHRIELGEIEACMTRQPGISSAVANVIEGAGAQRRIAAWVEIDEEAEDGFATSLKAEAPIGEAWHQSVQAASDVIGGITPDIYALAEKFEGIGNALALRAMIKTFDELGWKDGSVVDLSVLLPTSGILERYHRLIKQWCDALVQEGYLAVEGSDQFEISASMHVERAQPADGPIFQKQMADQHQASAGMIEWIVESTANLPAMLKGDVSPLEVLFPDGDYRRAESLYRDNPMTAAQGGAIAEAVSTFARTAGSVPLRVLEVGAGTGGITAYVASNLDPGLTNYTFTDLSDFFFQGARERFATANLDFARYDINMAPSEMNLAYPFDSHSY